MIGFPLMPTPPVKFPKSKPSSGKPPVRKGDGNLPGPAPTPDQNWKSPLLYTLLAGKPPFADQITFP